MATSDPTTMRLHGIAHARTGDKGNHSNLCVFAYRPEHYEILVAQVTVERVTELFAARKPTAVMPYLFHFANHIDEHRPAWLIGVPVLQHAAAVSPK